MISVGLSLVARKAARHFPNDEMFQLCYSFHFALFFLYVCLLSFSNETVKVVVVSLVANCVLPPPPPGVNFSIVITLSHKVMDIQKKNPTFQDKHVDSANLSGLRSESRGHLLSLMHDSFLTLCLFPTRVCN